MAKWLKVLLAALGLVLVIPALWIFVSLTAKPLHPDSAKVPTVVHSAPSPGAAAAAAKARMIALSHLAKRNLPGLSVAVGIDGEVVWAEGFGYADLKSSVPLTPDHRFRIGTASTALTSAGAGLLLQEGRLKLDDEIHTYVPALPKKQWPLTIRQLMSHTAGVKPDGDDGQFFSEHCTAPGEALRFIGRSPLLFEPGTQYRYSAPGWILVSAAMEAAAGQPFLNFMRQRVFEPLAMRNTMADSATVGEGDDFPLFVLIRELIHDPEAKRGEASESAKKPVPGVVTAYFTRFASYPGYGLHMMRPMDLSCHAGAGVFVSTPSDMVRFGMAMNGGKLLQPSTFEMLHRSQRLWSGEETAQGLGWYMKTVTVAGKQTRVIGQDGEVLGGMVSSLVTLPEYGVVVAAMSNIAHADTFSPAVAIAGAFATR